MKNNAVLTSIFMIVFFKLNFALSPPHTDQWVVWNVGQGQWVTHVESLSCEHFDVGGEFGSFRSIRRSLLSQCAGKQNRLFLSHWDYDHFLNIPSLAKAVPHLCWAILPEFAQHKKMAVKILELQIPICAGTQTKFHLWIPWSARNTNEASIVFQKNSVLLSGDSPIQQEKIWAEEIPHLHETRALVLGHHGSRTSTGKDLLSHLTNLKYAIASARYRKYRHPHPDTLKRLSEFQIPVLKTEDWGNIWFESK